MSGVNNLYFFSLNDHYSYEKFLVIKILLYISILCWVSEIIYLMVSVVLPNQYYGNDCICITSGVIIKIQATQIKILISTIEFHNIVKWKLLCSKIGITLKVAYTH